MKIETNSIASIVYELKDMESGQLIEKIDADTPQEFLFGAGMLVEGFEKNMIGLDENSSFDFNIPSEQAYGPREEEAVMQIPKKRFRGRWEN
jgi:FKBP-type peptidyl-prolyl cis-trans isomerase SlyD